MKFSHLNPDTFARALSLTGGGVRGVFAATALAELEGHFGCDLSKKFDLFVGTSVGGIIALGLACGMASGALPHKRESPVDDGRFRARGVRRREPGCDADPPGATRRPGALLERSGSLVQAYRSSNAIQEHSRSEQRGCRDFPSSRNHFMECRGRCYLGGGSEIGRAHV